MSIADAIVEFEKQLHSAVVVLDSGFGSHPGENDRIYRKRKELAEIALQALRAQLEAEQNEPLTLDELREMAQRCEGIYVTHLDGSPVFRNQTHCAAVLDVSPAFGSAVMHVHAIYGDRLTMWEDEYGKTWLAYRHKPKEEQPNDQE